MTKEENNLAIPIHSKENNLDLRIILLGDAGVGKKSMIQRFKLINCTETRNLNFNGFFRKQKRKKNVKKSPKEKRKKIHQKQKKTVTVKA